MGRKRHAQGVAGSDGVSYEEGDPLLVALFQHDSEAAERIVEAGLYTPDAVDQIGWRPLHRAVFGNHARVASMLLDRNEQVGAVDHDGLTPLHVAASGGHLECCRLLLDARADPTAPDVHGISPAAYTMACQSEDGPALRALLGWIEACFPCAEEGEEEGEDFEQDEELLTDEKAGKDGLVLQRE